MYFLSNVSDFFYPPIVSSLLSLLLGYMVTCFLQWDLVCDDQWRVPFASSTLFVGYLLGSLISGQLSDRYVIVCELKPKVLNSLNFAKILLILIC